MMINVSNDKYFLGKSILYNTCAFYRTVNVILTIVERIKVHSKLHVQVLFLLLYTCASAVFVVVILYPASACIV